MRTRKTDFFMPGVTNLPYQCENCGCSTTMVPCPLCGFTSFVANEVPAVKRRIPSRHNNHGVCRRCGARHDEERSEANCEACDVDRDDDLQGRD